jgi:outer membrane protein assembly factor BamB
MIEAVTSRKYARRGLSVLAGLNRWAATAVLLISAAMTQAASGDWPQFRGSDGNGISVKGRVPTEWSADHNLAWKTRLPGSGWSQPTVFGERIFVTTAVSDHPSRPKNYEGGIADPHTVSGGKASAPDVSIDWKVVALNLRNGSVDWSFTAASGKPKYPIHPSNTYASETPAADDRGIYAWFGAVGTVAALDHTGHLRWRRELGVFRQQENLGTASSLRLYKGLLFVQCFSEEQAFVVGLNTSDGSERWRINRTLAGTAWTTPFLWFNQHRVELIVCGQKLITSHDPMTGRELWRGLGDDMSGPSSPTGDQSRLYFGFKSTLKKTKLYALHASADGDQSVVEGANTFRCEAWSVTGVAPGMASPVVADGCVYVINDATVGCFDAASGQAHYKQRLPGFHCVVASPVAVGSHVIFLDESGAAVTIRTGAMFDLLGKSKLDDTFWASPTVAHDALILRGVDFIYCVRE